MSHVQNSKRVLEEAFQTGTAILTNMSGQRERLKVCPPHAMRCRKLPTATMRPRKQLHTRRLVMSLLG
jgi:hypothetical protein